MKLVAKDAEGNSQAPGETAQPSMQALIKYQTHVQTYGWKAYGFDGDINGTTGLSKRLEAIKIVFADKKNLDQIRYRTHVQTYGWQDWVNGDELSGTEGQSKRMEALQIELTGSMAEKYDIYYRLHVQTYGWLTGQRMVKKPEQKDFLKGRKQFRSSWLKKEGKAPGSTARPFVEAE